MGEFEDKLNGILNNPQEMEKIMNLARGLMGSQDTKDGGDPENYQQPSAIGGISGLGDMISGLDPELMKKLVSGLAGGVGTAVLLEALTPHLKEERRSQLKRAITIAQVVRVARSILGNPGGGDG